MSSVAVGVVVRVIGGLVDPRGDDLARFQRSQTSCARSHSELEYTPLFDAASARKA